MDERDARRWDVRWWDERAEQWGTIGQAMELRVARGAMGILLGLHRQVELVELPPDKGRRRS